MSKVVMIVDDDEDMQSMWNDIIEALLNDLNGSRLDVSIVNAFSIDEAIQKFFAHFSEIAAIVMDACVPGRVPNTQSLVRQIRNHFSGLMIAVSTVGDYRNQLVLAGCDRECQKEDLPYVLINLLAA